MILDLSSLPGKTQNSLHGQCFQYISILTDTFFQEDDRSFSI